ncbi:MAG: hypothetical protein ACSLFI_00630 [Solirubrobacterales bacterium]
MDFKKLGEQAGRLKKQAEDKLGDRAEPDNLKRDGKELRNIMSGDGSLAEKAREAKEKLVDRDPGKPGATEAAGPEPTKPDAPAAEAPSKKSGPSDTTQ